MRAVEPGAPRPAAPWRTLGAAAITAVVVAAAGPVSAQTRWSADRATELTRALNARQTERSRAPAVPPRADRDAAVRRDRRELQARDAAAQAPRRSREEQDRRARELPWSAVPWSATAWSDERRSR